MGGLVHNHETCRIIIWTQDGTEDFLVRHEAEGVWAVGSYPQPLRSLYVGDVAPGLWITSWFYFKSSPRRTLARLRGFGLLDRFFHIERQGISRVGVPAGGENRL
jgi:hypothetical protein